MTAYNYAKIDFIIREQLGDPSPNNGKYLLDEGELQALIQRCVVPHQTILATLTHIDFSTNSVTFECAGDHRWWSGNYSITRIA